MPHTLDLHTAWPGLKAGAAGSLRAPHPRVLEINPSRTNTAAAECCVEVYCLFDFFPFFSYAQNVKMQLDECSV